MKATLWPPLHMTLPQRYGGEMREFVRELNGQRRVVEAMARQRAAKKARPY